MSKLTSFTSTPETDGLHAVYWSMRLVLFPSVFQVPGAYNSYLSQSWYSINVFLMKALMYLQYYQMSQFSANLPFHEILDAGIEIVHFHIHITHHVLTIEASL